MKIVRAGWTSASFLVYAGALLALFAAFAWQGVISDDYSEGGFAGWSVLFFGVALFLALAMRRRGRPLIGGLFAFVAVGLFAVMVVAWFDWWGWTSDDEPLHGFHWGNLGAALLVVIAAFSAIRAFHFPLLTLIAAGVGWYFVADLLSSGGNWSATVTLLMGFLLFFTGIALDGGDSRPYGFWVHVVAGLTIGGAFLYWWHTSDADWAGIIVVALVFTLVGAAMKRSSYAVLGVVGLFAATGHYVGEETFGFGDVEPPTDWAAAVGYLGLGLFLVLLGMLLHRRKPAPDAA